MSALSRLHRAVNRLARDFHELECTDSPDLPNREWYPELSCIPRHVARARYVVAAANFIHNCVAASGKVPEVGDARFNEQWRQRFFIAHGMGDANKL